MEQNTTTQQVPTQLVFNLGTTIFERISTVQLIKNAMAAAIMNQMASECLSPESEEFKIYQTFYLEANYLEGVLKKV